MVDKVRPLKIEKSTDGGGDVDPFPTELDPVEDYVSVKGVSFAASDIEKLDLSASSNITGPMIAAQVQQKVLVDEVKPYIVEAFHQLQIFEDWTVDGEVILIGDVVVFN